MCTNTGVYFEEHPLNLFVLFISLDLFFIWVSIAHIAFCEP